jgi:hypothetical protein
VDTNQKNITFKFNGNVLTTDNIMSCLETYNFYSGTVSMGNSSIIFNSVKSQIMLYIMSELINNSEDLEIEIQGHAIFAEALQQLSFTFEDL